LFFLHTISSLRMAEDQLLSAFAMYLSHNTSTLK
jgi:hypothetical protein